MPSTIVTVGALNLDVALRVASLPAAGETVAGRDLSRSPGGKASNQAAAIARLGGRVAVLGAVADDDAGRFLLNEASAAGVDTSAVAVLPQTTTGEAIITVDDAGENTIVLDAGANGLFAVDPARHEAILAGAGVVVLSLEVPLPAIVDAAAAAHAAGATVVLNPSPYRALPPELLAATDVLVVNELEAGQFAGEQPVLDVARESGVDAAVVTLGAQGARVLADGIDVLLPARRVRVVDTTGCGDAFTGALALALAQGETLETAARAAVDVAGYAAEGFGAQGSYPSRAQLDAWLAHAHAHTHADGR